MQLEVGSIHVDNLDFGARTALHDHTLVVDRDEIRRLVLEDTHFADVDVQIARPGDSVRIIHALDVVEPRWKVAGPGGVFPGFVSPPTTVGEGRTDRLAGVAVVEVGAPVPGEPTHFRQQVIDMAGPGAPYSPFGSTLNLLLEFQPNPALFPGGAEVQDVIGGSAEAADYNRAITHAGMRVAAHLGRLAQDVSPDDVETFALPPVDPGLTKVVCMYQVYRAFLYGLPVPLPVGTVLHPNECFDGALAGWRQSYRCTYWDQNNAILQELCRRHGKDLQFVGCVLFGDLTPYREEKERVASAAVKLARILGAEAALFLGLNGSNYAIDVMLALQWCEQAGIKTTLVYQDVGEGPDDPGFIFAVPDADAIVCAGSRDLPITLPGLQQVIGGDHLVDPEQDARGEIRVPIRYLHSACALQGFNRLSTRFD
jgi:sarcosine reductase